MPDFKISKEQFYALSKDERDKISGDHYGHDAIKFVNSFRISDYKKGEMYVITRHNGEQMLCTVDYKRKNKIRFRYCGGWMILAVGKEDSWESFMWLRPVKMQRIYGDMPDNFFKFIHKRYNVPMKAHVHGIN